MIYFFNYLNLKKKKIDGLRTDVIRESRFYMGHMSNL